MSKPLPSMTDRTWLILGASSPIARAFARLVAGQGARLILAGRDRDDLARSAADLRLRGASARRRELTPLCSTIFRFGKFGFIH